MFFNSQIYKIQVFKFLKISIIQLIKKLVIETRKENGCIQYDLFEDVRNKGVFFIHEQWETNENLQSHQASEHMIYFRENIATYMEEPNKVYLGNKLF